MTMVLAGSDDAGAVPFRGDLCRTAASKKRTRIALQLDDGAELLARGIENARGRGVVGKIYLFCVSLSREAPPRRAAPSRCVWVNEG